MTDTVIRTKVIEMDGARVTIAPLTLVQIEQYIAPIERLKDPKHEGKIRTFDLICNGLNNALPTLPEGEKKLWTLDRVRAELDLVLFERLQREILDLSGFALDEETLSASGEGKVGVPGELSAARKKDNSGVVPVISTLPSSTSESSAAAS